MSKFNRPLTVEEQVARHPDATTNYEGGLAFKVSPEMELYLRACTSLVEDKFYTSTDKQLEELRELIHKCDRKFVLQLANYVRNRLHLRSIAIVLLAEASVMQSQPKEPKTDVRAYVPKIIRRADEPMELVSYWINVIGNGSKKNFPNSLRKGLSDAISQFDEYQLAKYNRDGAVKLRDVLFITHAKAKDGGPRWTRKERKAGLVLPLTEGQKLLDRAVNGELKTPDTWEVKISTEGATAENWNEAAKSMGIMALIRNLRNFEKHGAQEAIDIAIQAITDPELVKRSKQLPFRWFQALQHVTSSRLRDALHTAMNLSLANVEPWTGKTAIFSDNSGSMRSTLSSHGSIRYMDVAALMSAMAMALSPEEYYVGAFGTDFKWVDVTRHDSILTNMARVMGADVGWSTNAWLAIKNLREQKIVVDRVLLFSDMQCYNTYGSRARHLGHDPAGESLASEWKKYLRSVNPNARLYSIDLAGYGTSQFAQDDPSVVLLAGWSESVLGLIRDIEQSDAVLNEIKSHW